MPDLGALTNRAQNGAFQNRVKGALIIRAREMYLAGETTAGPANYRHATSIIRDVNQYIGVSAWVVATSPGILDATDSAVTDTVVQNAVNQAWPYLAGLGSGATTAV